MFVFGGQTQREATLFFSSCLPPLPLCVVESPFLSSHRKWGEYAYLPIHCITQKREVELGCSVSLFCQPLQNTLEAFYLKLRSNKRLDYHSILASNRRSCMVDPEYVELKASLSLTTTICGGSRGQNQAKPSSLWSNATNQWSQSFKSMVSLNDYL